MVPTEPERAAAALRAANVPFSVRKESAGQAEVDILLPRSYRRAADEALARAGFQRYRARGLGAHRFYLSCMGGRWLKVDAKLDPPRELPALLRRVARQLPLRARRAGPVVAILGPDGAGKGTVVGRLTESIPVGTEVLYFGWRPRRRGGEAKPPRQAGALRESAFLVRGWLGALRKLRRGYAAAWRGAIVLCDRHPLDALATRPARTPVGARVERLLVSRFLPRPVAVVVLDAPADLLLERKGAHSVEVLERWRRGYREAFGEEAVVSTADATEATVVHVSEIVWRALASRRGWPAASGK
jgi:thymidylate kinase